MNEPLHKKVQRIVHRFGFHGIRVANGKPGHVTLSGSVNEINDRALVIAIARTTPGVQEIRSDITLTK